MKSVLKKCFFCPTMTTDRFNVYTGVIDSSGTPSIQNRPCCIDCMTKEPDHSFECSLKLLGKESNYAYDARTNRYKRKESLK